MTTCPKCKYHHVDELAQVGVCRRYPPQAQQLGANWNASFPLVNKNWTCGEFKETVAAPQATATPPHVMKIARELAKSVNWQCGGNAYEPEEFVSQARKLWEEINPVDNAKPPIDAA